jgi:hypothetical protein
VFLLRNWGPRVRGERRVGLVNGEAFATAPGTPSAWSL